MIQFSKRNSEHDDLYRRGGSNSSQAKKTFGVKDVDEEIEYPPQ